LQVKRDIQRYRGPAQLAQLDHQKDVWQWYSQFDFLVHPATLEAFGLCIIEAMYAECVVVAERAAGPRDIIEDARTGLLVGFAALDDVVQRMAPYIENIDERRKMGRRASRNVVERYRVSRHTDQVTELLCR